MNTLQVNDLQIITGQDITFDYERLPRPAFGNTERQRQYTVKVTQ